MDQDRMERDDDVEMETDTETGAERRTAEVAELEDQLIAISQPQPEVAELEDETINISQPHDTRIENPNFTHPNYSITTKQNVEVMKKYGTSATAYCVDFHDMQNVENPAEVVSQA